MSTPLDNLVYCLGLNEASGNALDLSGNGRHFTQTGTVPAATGKLAGARGPFTAANYFSRTVSEDVLVLDQSCAWSVWVKRGPGPATFGIFELSDSGGTVYQLATGITSSGAGVRRDDGLTTTVSVSGINQGVWSWLFCWYDHATQTIGLKLDNTEVNSRSVPGGIGVGSEPMTFNVGNYATPQSNNQVILEQICFWKDRIPNVYEQNGIYNAGAGTLFSNFGSISDQPTTRLRMDQRLLRPSTR